MNLRKLLDCPPERVTLFIAARFAGKEAAEEQFLREKEGVPNEGIYLADKIEEDKAAKVEFAISYLIRMSELRAIGGGKRPPRE